MGYKYQRKSTRGAYGVDKLNEALHKVRTGELSKRKAEYIYGVPRKTISRHLAGKVAKVGNLGRYECMFAKEVEQALVDHALKLQLMFFGLSTTELRQLAYDLAVKLKVQHRFKNQCAGKSWLRGFLARHPELVVRLRNQQAWVELLASTSQVCRNSSISINPSLLRTPTLVIKYSIWTNLV